MQRREISQKVIHWPDLNVALVHNEHIAYRNNGRCHPSTDMGDSPDKGTIIDGTKRFRQRYDKSPGI